MVFVSAKAQTDTTRIWLTRQLKETSNIDSAVYRANVYKVDTLWQRHEFYLSGRLYSRAHFLDKELRKRHGSYVKYFENGTVQDSSFYQDNLTSAEYLFYSNGQKMKEAIYDKGKLKSEVTWDQEGKVQDKVFSKVEREARFPGGPGAWLDYLRENLKGRTPKKDKAPKGTYTVRVQFLVDKEGNVTQVQAIDVPPLCPSCGVEAVRVVSQSPKWMPAVQNARNVIYQAIQHITFTVE
jgi:hypothetical protein